MADGSQSRTAVLELDAPVKRDTRPENDRRERRQPRYHVVLWDDDEHSYDYVVRMMQQLFGYSYEKGYKIACDVDAAGRTVCLTTTREHAELKRDQVHAFGRDALIASCKGAMSCTIEPEETPEA
ncbi:MAG: ATP-dependent Clp protease adaptor ClpS [Planctomycetales bacterium]|nr:ATP-dependent Clp protease adaptor ClpS [Planctomycetales bacterium]